MRLDASSLIQEPTSAESLDRYSIALLAGFPAVHHFVEELLTKNLAGG